jgi:hypothetical protein
MATVKPAPAKAAPAKSAPTKAAPAKKAATAKAGSGITGYNVRTKTKEDLIDPVINVKNNRFIAVGLGGDGGKITSIMNQAKAVEAIEQGRATAGEGWSE